MEQETKETQGQTEERYARNVLTAVLYDLTPEQIGMSRGEFVMGVNELRESCEKKSLFD